MKPHPRIRKTVKWGGAAATVLLATAFLGSIWFTLHHESPGVWIFAIDRCAFAGLHIPGAPEAAGFGWHLTPHPADSVRWFLNWTSDSRHSQFFVPIWMPIAASLLLTAWAWRLDTLARRRTRLNLCPTGGCNYDRTGLAAGAVCPECGKLPA